MTSIINPPPTNSALNVIADQAGWTAPWRQWCGQVFNILLGVTQSGTTADRPTMNLWIGRPYFDTTLGYQINVKTVAPIVWVNGSGAPV